MPAKKRNPCLCKLYSFYREKPEEFLVKIEVDNHFHRHIFDIYHSQHRSARVSKDSKKMSFAIKFSQACNFRTQQRFVLQEEVNVSQRELSSLVNSMRTFLEEFEKRKSVYRFHYQNAKMRLDLQSQKTVFWLITIKLSLKIQPDIFFYHFHSMQQFLRFFYQKV